MVFFIVSSLILGGCGSSSQDNNEGFAIYLAANGTSIDELAILSHIDIADEPIIGLDDIVSYNWETHDIKLTEPAAERVDILELIGKPFVVCVDRAPIYAGAFWSNVISRTYDGVVILHPLEEEYDSHTLRIQCGYPWESYFSGDDPRSDPAILTSLEKAGKL